MTSFPPGSSAVFQLCDSGQVRDGKERSFLFPLQTACPARLDPCFHRRVRNALLPWQPPSMRSGGSYHWQKVHRVSHSRAHPGWQDLGLRGPLRKSRRTPTAQPSPAPRHSPHTLSFNFLRAPHRRPQWRARARRTLLLSLFLRPSCL